MRMSVSCVHEKLEAWTCRNKIGHRWPSMAIQGNPTNDHFAQADSNTSQACCLIGSSKDSMFTIVHPFWSSFDVKAPNSPWAVLACVDLTSRSFLIQINDPSLMFGCSTSINIPFISVHYVSNTSHHLPNYTVYKLYY